MTSTTSMQRERRSGELDLFGLYLNQVGRHPLVTKQDEIQLSQAYRQGLDAKLALAGLAAADPRRPGLEARAERGEQARRRIWRLSSTHVSPGVSPPAITRPDSGGLAGFGAYLSSANSTQEYLVDADHQPTDQVVRFAFLAARPSRSSQPT